MKVLITPLNWGLGHASRCIPIIQELHRQGINVSIASDGSALRLLRLEFPFLECHELPSYGIDYSGSSFVAVAIRNIPRMIWAKTKERRAINKLVEKKGFNIIISDNRFGCYSSKTHNVYISHQLKILSPIEWLAPYINKINKKYISCFDEIWVPDFKNDFGLAGVLSHEHSFDPVYLGILSRMEIENWKKKYDIAIVLSGPEPKRTELEEEILQNIPQLKKKKIILIRGLVEEKKPIINKISGFTIVPFMTSKELNEAIGSSEFIISRSGYSSIMDFYALEKKVMLIPTPGQTEQEYLAERLSQKNICEIQIQGQIDLTKALANKDSYTGFRKNSENVLEGLKLKKFIHEWIHHLRLQKIHSTSND